MLPEASFDDWEAGLETGSLAPLTLKRFKCLKGTGPSTVVSVWATYCCLWRMVNTSIYLSWSFHSFSSHFGVAFQKGNTYQSLNYPDYHTNNLESVPFHETNVASRPTQSDTRPPEVSSSPFRARPGLASGPTRNMQAGSQPYLQHGTEKYMYSTGL